MTKPQHPARAANPPRKDAERLAQALRENLHRRKAQARARASTGPGSAQPPRHAERDRGNG